MIIRQLNSFGNYWSYAIQHNPTHKLRKHDKPTYKRMIENKMKCKHETITLECNASLIQAWVGPKLEPK